MSTARIMNGHKYTRKHLMRGNRKRRLPMKRKMDNIEEKLSIQSPLKSIKQTRILNDGNNLQSDVSRRIFAWNKKKGFLPIKRPGFKFTYKGKLLPEDQLPGGDIGRLVFYRTYSRMNKKANRLETWKETCERVVTDSVRRWGCEFTPEEQNKVFELMYYRKMLPAGRILFQSGTKTLDRYGNQSLFNCVYIPVKDIYTLCSFMHCLMLGCGVGFNVKNENVKAFPSVYRAQVTRTSDDDHVSEEEQRARGVYIVPDSREGWCDLIRLTMEAHTRTGVFNDAKTQVKVEYSLRNIRNKGVPLKAFGGTSGGSKPLQTAVEEIGKLIDSFCSENGENVKLDSVHFGDLHTIIARAVGDGNVRRSATLALGDPDDDGFLQSKRWSLGSYPVYRNNANHTVSVNHPRELTKEFWVNYEPKTGEPYGIYNINMARNFGRTGETQYPDENASGLNPCAEQTLDDNEACCLSGLNVFNIKDEKEFKEAARLSYIMNKHIVNLPNSHPEIQKVVQKNNRMGISITGLAMVIKNEETKKKYAGWFDRTYKFLRAYDTKYSKEHGMSFSKKLTTVKPDGTCSLMSGVTPGCHPAEAEYYYRRIRVSSDNPLLLSGITKGYPTEFEERMDGSVNKSTTVITYPQKVPHGALTYKHVTLRDQFEINAFCQKYWADNAVSMTIRFAEDELDELKNLVNEFFGKIKTVSFLHILKENHDFPQPPYEEITREVYDRMVREINSVNRKVDEVYLRTSRNDEKYIAEGECKKGSCGVR